MTASPKSPLSSARELVERYRRAFEDVSERPPLRLPEVIQFPVNDICNSRCVMCDIWEQKRGFEIPPAEVRRAFATPVFAQVRSVGVNGGEPTLRKDLPELVAALADALPSLEHVHLITNAIRVRDVERSVEGIVERLEGQKARLHVMVSLDGVGEVHDRVRQRPGNFETAVAVLDRYQGDPRLGIVNIGCTISRPNAEHLEELLYWALDRDLPARFRLAIPHQRLYSDDDRDIFQLSSVERHHVVAFLDSLHRVYEVDPVRAAFYLSLRNQLAYGAARAAGCPWKNRGVTVLSNGDLAYCAVASPVIGNVLTDDVESAFWGGRGALERIQQTRCASCAHDYSAPGRPEDVARRIRRNARARLPAQLGRAVDHANDNLREARAAVGVALGHAALLAPRTRHGRGAASVPRFLLTGWYGTETLGDKAILAGVIASLRQAYPDAKVTIASLEPWVTQHTVATMPELVGCDVIALADAPVPVAGGRFDGVFVAGGPLMSPVSAVYDLARVQLLARRHGAVTGLLGCGIGPLGMRGRDAAIAELVATSDVLFVRDARSAALASRHVAGGPAPQVIPDPAMIWLAGQRRTLPTRPRFGFALRQLPHAEYAPHLGAREYREQVQRFEHEVRRCALRLRAAVPSAVMVPFAMHRLAVGGDDRPYLRGVFAGLEGVEPVVLHHRDPAADAADIASFTGLVGMRFHSLVFALGLGVPLTAVDYTAGGKSHALLQERDLGDHLQAFAEFDGTRAAEQLLAQDRANWQDRAAALAQVAQAACTSMASAVQRAVEER